MSKHFKSTRRNVSLPKKNSRASLHRIERVSTQHHRADLPCACGRTRLRIAESFWSGARSHVQCCVRVPSFLHPTCRGDTRRRPRDVQKPDCIIEMSAMLSQRIVFSGATLNVPSVQERFATIPACRCVLHRIQPLEWFLCVELHTELMVLLSRS